MRWLLAALFPSPMDYVGKCSGSGGFDDYDSPLRLTGTNVANDAGSMMALTFGYDSTRDNGNMKSQYMAGVAVGWNCLDASAMSLPFDCKNRWNATHVASRPPYPSLHGFTLGSAKKMFFSDSSLAGCVFRTKLNGIPAGR